MNEERYKIIFGKIPYQLIFEPINPSEKNSEAIVEFNILASAGNFSGSCKTCFTRFMLQQFHKALQSFGRNAKGEFTLYSESREFWASITGDGSGSFIAHCTLNDCDHRYTRLRFQIKFTSDDLQPNIRVIDNLISSTNP